MTTQKTIPAEVAEKLKLLKDFMSDKAGRPTEKYLNLKEDFAKRFCEAFEKDKKTLDRVFRDVLDEYVYN